MTFLRWAGSKKQLLDVLSCCWHAANCSLTEPGRYIEAFSGSAALFFRIAPNSAILVDINQELQQCLQCVRTSPKAVNLLLEQYNCTEDEYYRIRAIAGEDLSRNERAAIFIYLNRNCFNGLYRTNSKGKFNVPYGGARAGKLPTLEHLKAASRKLKNAELLTGDFFELIAPRLRPHDFVYMDPPYAKRNNGLDNQYGPDVFGAQDIQRLSALAMLINKQGGNFVISYADCEEIQPLRSQWNAYQVQVKRTIAADVGSRQAVKELLITNL
jgi:DNA adenine methylase